MGRRYARQEACQVVGHEGQVRLGESTVTIAGMGAIGSAIADLLARAGVGNLRIIDFDRVELDNLQRQCLYDENDAHKNRLKVEAAAERIARINSDITCTAICERIDEKNVDRLIHGSDVVVDAVDCFDTRYVVCAAAVRAKIPWVYGAVAGTVGTTMTVLPGESACLACLFPTPPAKEDVETARTSGVLGSIVHAVASLQVVETLKLVTGRSQDLRRGLLQIDIWDSDVNLFPVRRRPECPICGSK